MFKTFFRYVGYRTFCILFFLAVWLAFYLFHRWFILGPDSDFLNAGSFISAVVIYFAMGMYRRREIYDNLKSETKGDGFFWFHILFRIVVFFIVWAGLCILLEICDRTVFRRVINFYITEEYGYRWLLLVALAIEYKYRYDRRKTIYQIWVKYKNR